MNSEVVNLEETEEAEVEATALKASQILIKFCFQNNAKRFLKHPHIVQGEPFTWGVKIKNIDSIPTPEASITSAHIRDLNKTYFESMDENEIFVRSLNPDEEIYIKIDNTSVFLEGIQWAELDIEPKDDEYYFETHQFNEMHNKITKYFESEEEKNEWMDSIYIQKKIELLQSKTNNYILLLTVITVWESVFGIKETLRNLLNLMSTGLVYLGEGVKWVVSFL